LADLLRSLIKLSPLPPPPPRRPNVSGVFTIGIAEEVVSDKLHSRVVMKVTTRIVSA